MCVSPVFIILYITFIYFLMSASALAFIALHLHWH
jgi:hypothetical protein